VRAPRLTVGTRTRVGTIHSYVSNHIIETKVIWSERADWTYSFSVPFAFTAIAISIPLLSPRKSSLRPGAGCVFPFRLSQQNARASGIGGLAGGVGRDARGHGGDGRLLEAGLARTGGALPTCSSNAALGILARTWMDRYNQTRDPTFLLKTRDLYRQAFEAFPKDYYTGINVDSKSLLAGEKETAAQLARHVQDLVGDKPVAVDYWKTATIAEVQLLQGNLDAAAALYKAAVLAAPLDHGSHESSYGQAKLLLSASARLRSKRRRSPPRSPSTKARRGSVFNGAGGATPAAANPLAAAAAPDVGEVNRDARLWGGGARQRAGARSQLVHEQS
jgi:hypothetical protein